MAYAGSTSGSTVANPPGLVSQLLAGSTNTGSTNLAGQHLWVYKSTHVQTDVDNTGFMTDAQALGMELGDAVFVLSSTGYSLSIHTVQALSSTGATLSAGLLVSSAS